MNELRINVLNILILMIIITYLSFYFNCNLHSLTKMRDGHRSVSLRHNSPNGSASLRERGVGSEPIRGHAIRDDAAFPTGILGQGSQRLPTLLQPLGGVKEPIRPIPSRPGRKAAVGDAMAHSAVA